VSPILPHRTTIGTGPAGEAPSFADLVADRVAGGDRFAGLYGTADDHGGGGGGLRLTALLATPKGIEPLDTTLPVGAGSYPSLTPSVPGAFWYEREIHDLFGVRADGHPRMDPLVLPLPDGAHRPLPGVLDTPGALRPDEHVLEPLVVGTGLFTIPHGPVRSGVFESVEYLVETPGEDIPLLRIRVYAKHRGIEKRFEQLSPDRGVLLAERVEGIASVAHALAYSHALETLAEATVPAAAQLVRVVHAELERVANHLDVAMKLADAAGLAVATARMGWHKERVLRLVGRLCGSRFGRGVVVPGGVRALPALPPADLLAALDPLQRDVTADARLLMATSSFLDRLRRTGPLPADDAVAHGVLGPVARGSGFDDDDRDRRGYDAYPRLSWQPEPVAVTGDALARLAVRWAEVAQSWQLIRQAVDELAEQPDPGPRTGSGTGSAAGPLAVPVEVPDGRGIGWAEAPQGEVVYAVDVEDGRQRRVKPRSASFHNLAVFPSTFRGDILTDFPFNEASFGLSIAGVAG
jgi:formate hydrogenlyase subunit 5